jgi:hypothetical protein
MLALILVFLLIPVTAYAETEKAVPVQLSVVPDEISLGESITVTAALEKRGSSFLDSWTNAQKVGTEYDEETGQYLSTAEFRPTEAGIYEIIYQIDMDAGGSGVFFTGEVKKTVIVKDTKTVIGAEIRNLTQSPIMSGDVIIRYMVTGQAYAIWSDGTETNLNQAIFAFFNPYEYQKQVLVSFILEGETYQFTTYISRMTVPASP